MNLKGYRANVINYTVAMFGYLYSDQINLSDVWKKQSLSNKWDDITRTIALSTLNYLRDSAGDRNVNSMGKQEVCWEEFKEEAKVFLDQMV